ncbi:divergent polysaccharide deacetylase family protein [Tepidamorphus sp. 3E244]|uniref:divergent polysaccharide deacetylase family protein n=1 Tax=Tepidamorphus sp. 3E244 TaxID=3385498 RepID=UPI0038FD1670
MTPLNAAIGALAALLLFVLGWMLFVNDPLGGEPVARAPLHQPAHDGGQSQTETAQATIRETSADEAETQQDTPAQSDGGRVVISDPVAGAIDGKKNLVESTRYGSLPRISESGERPLDAYAREAPSLVPSQPRIAIILSGMGLSSAGTEDAIRRMPADVTFAFAPYGRDLRRLVRLARTDGHELLLQAPLEPYDYPDNDPGPHTLLTGLPERQNQDRLHWVMARMVGYVGMLNHMGAKFVADEAAVNPFLTELRNRGLLYVDDGSAPQSTTREVSGRLGLSFAKADAVIDSKPDRESIDEVMNRLVELAADRGYAVGVASALPGTLSALQDWIKVLESRNIAIVPVTALTRFGAS